MSANNVDDCPFCGGSFREDWECGLDRGTSPSTASVSYLGQCRDCGASARIDAWQTVLPGRKAVTK